MESEWISAEILHFRKVAARRPILTLLIEGEPATSFPRALYEIRVPGGSERGVDQDEPLAADVRQRPGTSPRTAGRLAKLKLLATLLDCKFDDLRRREQERRFRWLGC